MKRIAAGILTFLLALSLAACGEDPSEQVRPMQENQGSGDSPRMRPTIEMSGPSMEPTLHDGDKLLVQELFSKPQAGDIIAFIAADYDPEKVLVRRVIATEGQEVIIDFQNGVVCVDGEPLDEPYAAEPTHTKLDFINPQTVPEGCVFVLGDNRNSSRDSRYKLIGMVEESAILGVVYGVLASDLTIRPLN